MERAPRGEKLPKRLSNGRGAAEAKAAALHPEQYQSSLSKLSTGPGLELRLLPTPRTQHSETLSSDHPRVTTFTTTPPDPPPLLVDADRSRLRLFDVDTDFSNVSVVREFATSKFNPTPFPGLGPEPRGRGLCKQGMGRQLHDAN